MSMAHTDFVPLWRGRAIRTGFHVLHGKQVAKMTEQEIKTAFDIMSREYGFSYVWGHR